MDINIREKEMMITSNHKFLKRLFIYSSICLIVIQLLEKLFFLRKKERKVISKLEIR